MNLHHDREAFEELLIGAANELAIPTNIIEKDYYVTITLKMLANKLDNMVFKGGTSLTKCYYLLDRFSEDIDLSYTAETGNLGEAGKGGSKRRLLRLWKNWVLTLQILKLLKAGEIITAIELSIHQYMNSQLY